MKLSNAILALHGWTAPRKGHKYRVISSILRLIFVKLEGAPKEVVDMELEILRERWGKRG